MGGPIEDNPGGRYVTDVVNDTSAIWERPSK